jgi:ABC-2 type transport system permease protein
VTGWQTLFYKEVLRFWKVSFQTVAAPVLTAVLYLLIFGHVLEDHVKVYDRISYTAFLVPGLVMMSVLQNAFANSSSSLVQSKIMGSLVFLLLTPLSHWAWFVAYVGSSVVRGLVVGLGVFIVTLAFARPEFAAPLWIVVFALLGAALLATLGLIAGLWADKFDQMAAFQNFVIVPMTFLSGVFYSIQSLPPFWQTVSHLNPFFYMIDGFRYGFFGQSDTSPWLSLGIVGIAWLAVSALAVHLLRTATKFGTDMTADQLKDIIAAGLACEHITLEGDGRHWYATIVSAEFEGKRAIQRHQRVYATLGAKLANDEVHALSMKTFTPAEWATQAQ